MNGVDFDVVVRQLSGPAEEALLSDRIAWRKRASHQFSHFESIVISSLLAHISQSVGFSPNTIGFLPGRTRVGLAGWTKSLPLLILLHPNNAPMVTIASPITRNATTSVGDPFAVKKLLII